MKKAYRVTIWCENGYLYTSQWFRKLEIPDSYSLYQVHRLRQGSEPRILEQTGSNPKQFPAINGRRPMLSML